MWASGNFDWAPARLQCSSSSSSCQAAAWRTRRSLSAIASSLAGVSVPGALHVVVKSCQVADEDFAILPGARARRRAGDHGRRYPRHPGLGDIAADITRLGRASVLPRAAPAWTDARLRGPAPHPSLSALPDVRGRAATSSVVMVTGAPRRRSQDTARTRQEAGRTSRANSDDYSSACRR